MEDIIYLDLKYFIIDVDGTMTDGSLYYDNYGNEMKSFSTKDAAGIWAAQQANIKIVILTGRECFATTRRMRELNVNYIFQNVKDKYKFLKEFILENRIEKSEIGYIGDDLNDFSSMLLTGYIACPADSCQEIKEIANYISSQNGGHGAVRDIIEHYLRENKQWKNAISCIYNIGI